MCSHRAEEEKKIYQKFYEKVLSVTVAPKDTKIFCSINS